MMEKGFMRTLFFQLYMQLNKPFPCYIQDAPALFIVVFHLHLKVCYSHAHKTADKIQGSSFLTK